MKKKKDTLPKHIWDIFYRFKKMKKGELVKNPTKKLLTNLVVSEQIWGLKFNKIYFTNKSLKHLSEKKDLGEKLLKNIHIIFKSPHETREAKNIDRFFLIGDIRVSSKKVQTVVTLEKSKNESGIIITIFPTNKKYLEKFELVWRTAKLTSKKEMSVPPYAYQQNVDAGGRTDEFSAHKPTQSSQSTKSSISKPKQKGQATL
ncbi:MAG: hypothetical protein K9L98_01400 [Candidatus Pacebacteria bacterium]|nr:hypothetical protein [Candidatus Paceibacterota bacterium]MCF7862648.1 hypothetical protein [Candidatus Paceibacterota bacterium]